MPDFLSARHTALLLSVGFFALFTAATGFGRLYPTLTLFSASIDCPMAISSGRIASDCYFTGTVSSSRYPASASPSWVFQALSLGRKPSAGAAWKKKSANNSYGSLS